MLVLYIDDACGLPLGCGVRSASIPVSSAGFPQLLPFFDFLQFAFSFRSESSSLTFLGNSLCSFLPLKLYFGLGFLRAMMDAQQFITNHQSCSVRMLVRFNFLVPLQAVAAVAMAVIAVDIKIVLHTDRNS